MPDSHIYASVIWSFGCLPPKHGVSLTFAGTFPGWMDIHEELDYALTLNNAHTYLQLNRSGFIRFLKQGECDSILWSEQYFSFLTATTVQPGNTPLKTQLGIVPTVKFRAEVQTIGTIQHINIVRLLGFCAEDSGRFLVYEYMPNGSLSNHSFSKSSSKLSWEQRYSIALGIARGLAYLHEECKDCIVHCDMKPDNVLLDAELCPRIADFGMAKLLGRDFSRVLTTMRGTIGYLAPEWISGLPITHKADVYSYGMMLLEIISGRRNSEKIKEGMFTYFPVYAAVKVSQGDAVCLLDSRLEGDADEEQLKRACKVACWCIQDAEDHRPMMGQVVHTLEGDMDVQVPPVPRSLQNYVGMEVSTDVDSF